MKQITIDYQEYKNELQSAKSDGQNEITSVIFQAKLFGLIKYDWNELCEAVNSAQHLENKHKAADLFRRGLL